MCSAATVNRYKPEGRPRQFLLQLVSDLTSILTVFLLFEAQNKDYGNNRKWSIWAKMSLARLVFFPVLLHLSSQFIVSYMISIFGIELNCMFLAPRDFNNAIFVHCLSLLDPWFDSSNNCIPFFQGMNNPPGKCRHIIDPPSNHKFRWLWWMEFFHVFQQNLSFRHFLSVISICSCCEHY